MEVNERIVEEYIKTVKGWFYMTDILFEVPHNYSNIDILAYNPKDDKYYDLEVKYRSEFSLPKKNITDNKEFQKFIKQFLRDERQKEIERIIGTNNKEKVVKVFVTTHKCFGTKNDIEETFKDILKKEKGFYSEVWYFDKIIQELVEKTNEKGKHNTELMQTIRLIKKHMMDTLPVLATEKMSIT